MGSLTAGIGLYVCRAIPLSFASAECADERAVAGLGAAVLLMSVACLLSARVIARATR